MLHTAALKLAMYVYYVTLYLLDLPDSLPPPLRNRKGLPIPLVSIITIVYRYS